jgi:hypothetical protein
LNQQEQNLWDFDTPSSIFPKFGLVFSNFRELSLNRMISDSYEVKEIIGKTGEKNFHVRPEMSGNHQMSGMERAFDHSERTFHQ